MAKKIILSGRFFERDVNRLQGEALEFVFFPKLDLMTDEDILRLRREAADADLLIIAMFGSAPTNLPRLGLEAVRCPKAYWSFDSHHQWPYERKHMALFDHIFLAHSPYCIFFDPAKIHWLPCAYTRFETEDLLEIVCSDPFRESKELDVASPFKAYGIGFRDYRIRRIREFLAKYRSYTGEVESGLPYMRKLQSAGVVLSLPLLDDLTIRNFEAWAFNRVLLTCHIPDMTRLGPLATAAFFFRRDLTDFADILEQALEAVRTPRNTTPLVVNGHMLAHRYAELINTALGTNLTVRDADAGEALLPEYRQKPPQQRPIAAHELNIGVTALVNKTLTPAPHFCATRLQIEDNIGESIHLHWRNLRLDFTVREFLALAKTLGGTLAGLTPPIRQDMPKDIGLSSSFMRDLGALGKTISGYTIEWHALDDMPVLLKTAEGTVARPLQESPVWALLDGDYKTYLDYQSQFPEAERSVARVAELVLSVLSSGYPGGSEMIVLHAGEPYIRDGQHRAVILRYFFGNIKVPVCVLHFEGALDPLMALGQERSRRPMPDKAEVKHLLYVRLDGIGDGILAGELLAKLPEAYPNAKLTVVCDTAAEPLYAAAPAVTEIIPLDKRLLEQAAYQQTAARLLRACGADMVFNGTLSPTAAVCSLLLNAGAPLLSTEIDTTNLSRAGKEAFAKWADALIPLQPGARMDIERTGDMLRYFGFRETLAAPRFWLSQEDDVATDAKLKEIGLEGQPFLALFVAGSVRQNAYELWGEALATLCAERGLPVVILGDGNGLAASRDIVAFLAERDVRAYTVCGELSLGVSAGIIRRSRLAAGADTGLAHIACAFGIPLVVLLGGGTFGRFFPYNTTTTAVCLPLECYRCNWGCPYDRAYCVADIAPETVRQAVAYTLDQEKGQERKTLFMQRPASWQPGPGKPGWRSPADFINVYRSKERDGLTVVLSK